MARQFSCLDVARVAGLIFFRKSVDECVYTCPCHDDKHPSLTINERKDTWMCGPCGVGGTPWAVGRICGGRTDPTQDPQQLSFPFEDFESIQLS
jgi:hypothetical protein